MKKTDVSVRIDPTLWVRFSRMTDLSTYLRALDTKLKGHPLFSGTAAQLFVRSWYEFLLEQTTDWDEPSEVEDLLRLESEATQEDFERFRRELLERNYPIARVEGILLVITGWSHLAKDLRYREQALSYRRALPSSGERLFDHKYWHRWKEVPRLPSFERTLTGAKRTVQQSRSMFGVFVRWIAVYFDIPYEGGTPTAAEAAEIEVVCSQITSEQLRAFGRHLQQPSAGGGARHRGTVLRTVTGFLESFAENGKAVVAEVPELKAADCGTERLDPRYSAPKMHLPLVAEFLDALGKEGTSRRQLERYLLEFTGWVLFEAGFELSRFASRETLKQASKLLLEITPLEAYRYRALLLSDAVNDPAKRKQLRFSTIRRFFEWLSHEGRLEANPLRALPAISSAELLAAGEPDAASALTRKTVGRVDIPYLKEFEQEEGVTGNDARFAWHYLVWVARRRKIPLGPGMPQAEIQRLQEALVSLTSREFARYKRWLMSPRHGSESFRQSKWRAAVILNRWLAQTHGLPADLGKRATSLKRGVRIE